jgi:predicted trehalose synthase
VIVIGDLDEVTYDLEVDGEEVRRTLHRRVWQRGGWATVAIAYQERAAGGDWKPAKLALIRFQRVRDAWKRHAAITLRGGDAAALGQTLAAWHEALAGGSGEPDDPDGAEP